MPFLFLLFALLILPCAGFAEEAPALPVVQPLFVDATPLPQVMSELARFHTLRDHKEAWNLADEKGLAGFIASIEALIAYHGLNPAPYPLVDLRAAANPPSDKQKLELLIDVTLLRLAHDLRGDFLDLDKIYPGWSFRRAPADLPVLLNEAIENGNLSTFFDKLAPANNSYRALTSALQTYRTIQNKGGWGRIELGSSLRPQDRSPRILHLRARLAAESYAVPQPLAGQEDMFDDALAQTLILYQTRNGLTPDGHVGAQTLQALNMPVAARIAQIRANMERWRSMPEDFPPDSYVNVNIPAFTVTIVEDGKEIYRGKVVDGRIDRPTPFIDSAIETILINPSWHVPLKIARKDILPKLQKDPAYLEKQGIEIVGRADDPFGAQIDWKNMHPRDFHYRLRQVPSDINSLGQIKFTFANPFDVYMHGTPHQELFDKPQRTFSSGCVRLEDPLRVAEILLGSNKDKGVWSRERILTEIASQKTRPLTLAHPIPIYILYESVFEDESKQINFRPDIYGYDTLR